MGAEMIWLYGPIGVELYSAWLGTGRDPPKYPGPLPVRSLSVASNGHVVALADNQIYYFDGEQWKKEYHEQDRYHWNKDISNSQEAMVVGDDERVLTRDFKSHSWRVEPKPVPRSLYDDLSAAVYLGGGRFLVAGDNGFIQWWNGERWCESVRGDSGTIRFAITGSRPGEVYLGGNDRESRRNDHPLLMRWALGEQ